MNSRIRRLRPLFFMALLSPSAAAFSGCFLGPSDGIFELTVENRFAQDMHILVDHDRDWGWVAACTSYSFDAATTAPFRHTIPVEARDAEGRVLYGGTVDFDPAKGIRTVTVRIPEVTTDECPTIQVSGWPTPQPRR